MTEYWVATDLSKNLRLLGIADPPWRQPDIFEMIRDLEAELAQGAAVYTAAELVTLEAKLAEYKALLRIINEGP
jgi:hypothetical protein